MKPSLLIACSLLFLLGPQGQAEDKGPPPRTLVTTKTILDLFTKPPAELSAIGVYEAPRITTHILFKTDSVELADAFSERQLALVGKALQDDRLASYSFSVEGHTDARGSDAYNMKLSQRRSEEIKRRLIKEYGIAENRLFANGRGKFEPVDPRDTEEAHQKNRRVVFVRE